MRLPNGSYMKLSGKSLRSLYVRPKVLADFITA